MERETDSNEPQSAPAGALTSEDVETMLNRADIILTRGGGLTSRVIRWFTDSYWNHAAIVFALSDNALRSKQEQEQGYQSTFILEAEPQGVDAHSIDKYLYEEKQDMVILRFPDSALPPGRREFLRRVRGFALEEIDAVYGYLDIVRVGLKKGQNVLRRLGRLFRPLGRLFRPAIGAIRMALFNRNKAINDFVCSGVVQYAYYRACRGVDPDDGTRWDDFFQDAQNVGNLIVNLDIQAAVKDQPEFAAIREQLELTTPADFSRAAQDNRLECVAERVKGVWRRELTKV
jgi:hypothetical protein